MDPLIQRMLAGNAEYQLSLLKPRLATALADFIATSSDQPHEPAEIFDRLRWGGVCAYACEHRREAADVARRFAENGFAIEAGPSVLREKFLGFPLPFLSRQVHYFLARKVLLIRPGQSTDRFTYDVRLVRQADAADPLAVTKQVPSYEAVLGRLTGKFPEVGPDLLERRARKFINKIFPTFLTREAAILMILQEHLPAEYARRVPAVLGTEHDDRGFVRKLRMRWLRNGGDPLGQLEFARQSADLLRAIHDDARVIHLDLRLDNFVITPQGVGFVDFGSAVREDENLSQDPMVGSLFEELMRTSQIQRMLNEMTMSGHVTSDIIRQSRSRADKAIDFFYLAVQFNAPHSNPDLVDLIEYDPASAEAKGLAKLTGEILRPADPANPRFRSAKDILEGIERIQLKLDQCRR